MPKRNAQGAGTIRQRKDGRWEGRYTAGRNPGTGRQIQKSVYGDTQKEVLQKLQRIQTDITSGIFIEPSKLTVGAWLDIWIKEYLNNVKQSTQASYSGHIRNHIKPELGFVPLQKLQPHHIQSFYNELQHKGTSPKTIKNIHGSLHSALSQAVKLGYMKTNPSEPCVLPKVTKKEIQVIPDNMVSEFLRCIEGHRFEAIYYVDLFTGMRQAELLGLTWDCVDFEKGTILINKQLSKEKKRQGKYYLDTTKHDKIRKIKPANLVMIKLKEQRTKQTADKLKAGGVWDNPLNLVFTDELGNHLVHNTVRKNFKRIVFDMGAPDLTFHSLRHSYAVLSLMNGDDIKTVQSNLGHHTAAFTLDTYAHVTDKMQKDSSRRMEKFIKGLKKT